MSRDRSPRFTSARKSEEYAINWSATFGIVATLAALPLAIALLWWADAAHQARLDAARRQPTERAPVVEHRPRDLSVRLIVLRHTESEAPPPLNIADIQMHGRYAQRTLEHLSTALQRAANLRSGIQLENLRQVATRLEQGSDLMLGNPACRVLPYSPATHDNYTQTEPEALIEYLGKEVPELDMQAETKVFVDLANAAREKAKSKAQNPDRADDSVEDFHARLLVNRIQERHKWQGLPLLLGDACRSEREVAVARNKLAFGVRDASRDLVYRTFPRKSLGSHNRYYDVSEKKVFDSFTQYLNATLRLKEPRVDWKHANSVTILEQMLQVEPSTHRLLLLNMLRQIEGRTASEAIARRALFDMDPAVRDAAANALDDRPRPEYAQVIGKGMNYPWAPVVERARQVRWKQLTKAARENSADSVRAPGAQDVRLVNIGQRAARPYQDEEGTWVMDELVKVNHLRNCVMCHQVSCDTNDPLRGQIPSPGERLPRIYYSSNKGNFVRADIVYLRQDFSVMLPVEDHGQWPQQQRFDFFVRTRPATGEDLQRAYDQRQYNARLLKRSIVALLQRGIDLLEFSADLVRQSAAKLPETAL